MKIFDLHDFVAEGTTVETILELVPEHKSVISVGMASFSEGTTHPETDMATHDQHEISYIIEGQMDLHLDGRTTSVKAGQVVWLEAGEKHASTALQDSKVFWVLCG
ncbi:cupin domain-containing protein [Pseudomaricurvus alkylphenolicus]|uniref:cupin domain-containing protein n=1 Tax=Pseudomaricurvus alkylphenolicus TaxID=1306991 RepID=UPI001423DF3E|nr:cupin domain-containing protein [Pseudomaricurvus alkylphenolicus]NIB40489.1 cupin domain-containing protein [Pseudomaricurvus alkylphenolicus]